MGALRDRVDLSMKVYGKDIVDYYKSNTIYMTDLYRKSDDMCTSIPVRDIIPGRFYFLHYEDPSNWMRYSPVFIVDYRKINDMIILMGVNFNFIPLEIRSMFFDKFISEQDFQNNYPLKVDFKGVYTELLRLGFEYSIVEYNAIQLKLVHQINLELLPRFFYSSHPKNTYDPNKLMEIWTKKIETKEKRHQEITLSLLNEFYDFNNEIDSKYEVLRDHIKRLQDSFSKFKNN